MLRGKIFKKIALTAFFFVLISSVFPFHASAAASLYFSPASGNYKLGKTFSVGVYVSSPNQSTNAYSGNISFDQDVINVSSISKSGSIISIWAREPAYSNSSGNISFEGIVTNPGYTGSAGKLITINFVAKAAGNASVRFVTGSVLANDGEGTNIVSGLGSGSYNVEGTQATPPEETAPANSLPPLPKVSSSSHAEQNSWYSNNNPVFNWSNPTGVNAVNFFGDRTADTDPGTVSDGLVTSHSFKNVEDGVWYFHLKFRNTKGWGPTAHYKFQIDRVNPTLEISAVDKDSGTISIKGIDELSGVDRYQIQIDSNEPIIWQDDGSHLYQVSGVSDGAHVIKVKALDKAGNFVEKETSFNYLGAKTSAPKIEKAGFPDFSKALRYGLGGLIALLVLLVLFHLWRKASAYLPLLFARTRKVGLKAAALESIEMLEKAAQHRDLSHEEEKILKNLRHALYGTAIAKKPSRSSEKVLEGFFDGQNMISSDGSVYEVPANYASKSKMVQGDKLRLAVKEDGGYVYKQVGPVQRQKKRGILGEQDNGEIRVIADGDAYKVSPATLMYFNAEPGDEVEVIVPKGSSAEWAAIQKVSKKKPEPSGTPLKRYKRSKKS